MTEARPLDYRTPTTEPPGRRPSPKQRGKLLWPALSLALLLAVDFVFVPNFFHLGYADGRLTGRLVEILRFSSPTILLSLGMALVLATGGVDLSVGAVMALAGAVTAALCNDPIHWPAWSAALAAVAVALLAGAWNGLLVTALEIQPIVATLVLMVAGRGVAMKLSGARHVNVNGAIFDFLGGSFAALPTAGLIALAVFALTAAFTRLTSAGLFIEASGANPVASRFAGVRVKLVTLLVYVFSGSCAGVAGLLTTGDLHGADAARLGLFTELDAILAAVLGGTALTGGRFSLAGAVIGSLFIETLNQTVRATISSEAILVAKAVVVLAVCLLQAEGFRRRVFGRR